ncbi:MAG TPA: N-acetyl-gamma-glutamyl-phosphate reductase [Acidimicrobiia bacterium]|nr:N-acetyl-gamma-glutamyl-phosphate reductase [Acidimicrobiia bacterium]
MAYRAAVVGASGYTGVEALRLLAGHPEIEVVHVTAASNAGTRLADLFPSLAPAYGDAVLAPVDVADLRGLDLVFCMLPHGASQDLLPGLLDDVSHVIDLGADFRLPPDVYARWYGEAHRAPDVVGRFAYGLVELYRDEISKHRHVAAPGCYPTAVNLACAPLFAMGLVEPHVIADAVSGVSGAGRALKTTSLFSEANENVSAYGLLTHRHTAEMELVLSKVARGPVDVLFTPHLAPTTRGLLATCYMRPRAEGLSTARLLEHYRDFYENDPCVVVVDEPSGTKATYGANVVHVTVRFDERTGTVIAIAAEDNLVKGASGQMIQAANVLLGLPETTGLPLIGIQP